MTVTEGALADTFGSVATLTPNGCKARYGVSYVRAVCSQAGVPFNETSPDEDVLAVDGQVFFDIANVSVQVKCSSQYKISGRSATWPAEVEWRDKWGKSKIPVYFILVILDFDNQGDWLTHDGSGTFHRSAAFWTRVDGMSGGTGINVPKNQRLTVDTFSQWASELDACFAPTTQGSLP